MTTSFYPFEGDGRQMAEPSPFEILDHCHPVRVNVATARRLIANAIKGPTHHSAQGATVWVLVRWAKCNLLSWKVEHYYIDDEIAGHTFTWRKP